MANKTLTTSYLVKLSVANHDGVTQQICDRLNGFTTDNQMLISARQGVNTARQAEDVAFKRFSGKDFASDDMKNEDTKADNYMSASLNILNGLLYLPETEPIYRKAQLARQVFKDFRFSTSDGMEAEARNILNMAQQWAAATDYTLEELGIAEWVQKAVVQANKVLQLVAVRVEHESVKVKGELADARKVTDAAIRQAYDVLNALAVLQPSAELTALINVLFAIEERAKLYYISSGSSSGGNSGGGGTTPSDDQGGGDQGGGEPIPDDPDPSGGGGEPIPDDPDPSGGGGEPIPDDPDPSGGGGEEIPDGN